MAIIYTYPKKASPVLGDLVVISDSQEQNKTKQSSLSGIKTLINTTYDFYPTGNAGEAFWNLEDNLAGGVQTIKMVGTGDATVSYDSLNNQIVVDSTHIDPPPVVYDLLAPAGSPAKIRLTGHSGDDDIELVSTNANLIINRVSDTEIQFTAAGGGGGGSPSYLGWIVEDGAANAFLVETGEQVKFLGTGGIGVTASDTAGFDPYTVTIDGSSIPDTTYTLGAAANFSNADVTLTGSDGSTSTLTFIAGTNIDDISVVGTDVTINAATQGGGGSCTWTVSGDTGDCLVDCGDTLDIISGPGISTEAQCSPLQLEINNTADIFKTVTADGGGNSVASGLSDTLTIAGGLGITTTNSGTGTITVSADWNTKTSYGGLELGAVGASSFAPSVSLCEYIEIGQYVMLEFYLQWSAAEIPLAFNGDTYIKDLPIPAANSASLAGLHGSCQIHQNNNCGTSAVRPAPTQGTVGLPTLDDCQLREQNTSSLVYDNYNFLNNYDVESGTYTLAGTIIYLTEVTPV
jgi:hypothetical protein